MADFYAKIPVYRHGYAWYGADKYGFSRLDIRVENPTTLSVENPFARAEPRPPLSDESSWRFYDLFTDAPGLFRVFADLTPYPWPFRRLTPTEIERIHDEILSFASEYGEFWLEMQFLLEMRFPMQVGLMREAIDLWKGITLKDKTILAKYLGFFAPGKYTYRCPPYGPRPRATMRAGTCPWSQYVHRRFGGTEGLQGWGLRDTVTTTAIDEAPEHWHNQPRKANDLLACATELFSLLVQSQTRSPVGRTVAVGLVRATAAPLLAVRVQVDDLLQALWIQLAVSLIENTDYRRCRTCGKPFEVGVKAKGKTVPRDKEFCTPSCRVRWCQNKQRLARKMRDEGAKLPDIVKAVESDLGTVKGWLKNK